MKWSIIGEYMSMPIRFAFLNSYKEYKSDVSLQHTNLTLYIRNKIVDTRMFSKFIEKIAMDLPLILAVSGENSRESFDCLLETTSRLDARGYTNEHIMTNIIESLNIKDILEDTVLGSFPIEERFDNWKTHSILQVGIPSKKELFINQIKKLNYGIK